jgi:hypothetical protein
VARPGQGTHQRQVLRHGEVVEQVRVLKQHADVTGPYPGPFGLGRWLIRWPAMRTLPPSGLSMPARHASSVDLPTRRVRRRRRTRQLSLSDTPCSARVSSSPAR